MARLKREHLVAAGLVGSVVVVVGFASGLGIRQPTSDTAQAQPQPHHVTPPRTSTSAETTSTQPAPAGGGGSGGGGVGGGGVVNPQPIQLTSPETHYPTTSTSSTVPTTFSTTTTSPPPCDPGLVRGLTDTVDGTVGGLTGLLGLPTKPLQPLLDPLLGTCQPAAMTSTTTTTP
jgi:hypothetical protein